ncbi:MAG: AAA family ATPase [Bryobacteraceae bacterium]|nr:AAA family ATPase [Bryobacteraceae bacterium]
MDKPAPKNFGQWRIISISPSEEMQQQLQPLFEEYLPFSNILTLPEYPTRAVLSEILPEHGANLCFVDAYTNREWAQALLNDLSMLDAKMPLVALHKDNDPDYILRTLRLGATEVLMKPVTAEQFVAVMERLCALTRGRGGEMGRVLCVMPAKGACGATTVACNLAPNLAKMTGKRVLLCDLDPLTGTVSFQLKVKSGYSFADAVSRAQTLDDDIWNGMVAPKGGFDVLLAPEKPVHGMDELRDAPTMIEFARGLYNQIVLDAGGPYGQWNLGLARLCDDLLLITTNELPSLQSAQRALAYLERNRVDRAKVKVVVNRFNKDIGLSRDVIEAALHCEVLHLLPSDYDGVQRALVEGKILSPTCELGRGFQQLSARLLGRPVEEPKPKPSGISGLFASILGR